MTPPEAGRAYAVYVAAAADRHGIPANLIWAVMAQESNFRPTAYRHEPKIRDGSHGLMQVLYRTARSLGYQGERGEAGKLTGLFDPATNINLGAMLLADNLDLTKSLEGAVSTYNGGFRPGQGFGRPAEKEIRVCLARDQVTGDCIKWREVKPGEYANQPYVTAVIARKEAYDGR